MKIVESSLPKEMFAQKAAPALIAQAVRVYLANQRQGTQSALTRAEVNRTGKKLYKQKGTGGARHGSKRAPIFVGGGATFAPKPRDHSLSLNSKMKKKALFGALTMRADEKSVRVVSGLADATGKTKEMAEFLAANFEAPIKNVIIVTDTLRTNVYRAAKNLSGITVSTLEQLSTYDVVRAKSVMIMEEALTLEKPEVKAKVEKVEVKKTETAKKAVAPKVAVKKAVVKKVAVKKVASKK